MYAQCIKYTISRTEKSTSYESGNPWFLLKWDSQNSYKNQKFYFCFLSRYVIFFLFHFASKVSWMLEKYWKVWKYLCMWYICILQVSSKKFYSAVKILFHFCVSRDFMSFEKNKIAYCQISQVTLIFTKEILMQK